MYDEPTVDITGEWIFAAEGGEDEPVKLIFQQDGNEVNGIFKAAPVFTLSVKGKVSKNKFISIATSEREVMKCACSVKNKRMECYLIDTFDGLTRAMKFIANKLK